MITDASKFKSISNIAAPLLMNELESNFKSYIDWAMLNIGGYSNVLKDDTGPYGGDFSALKMVPNSEYGYGKEWAGIRKDWVYEDFRHVVMTGTGMFLSFNLSAGTGVCDISGYASGHMGDVLVFSDNIKYICKSFTHPTTGTSYASVVANKTGIGTLNLSGNYELSNGTYDPIIYVDNTIAAKDSYYVNYPLGTVVFNNAVADSSSVQADYSYRLIQTYKADDVPWWQEIQFNSLRSDSVQFTPNSGQGDWLVGGEHRLQLPIIVVEAAQRGDGRPYEMGNEAVWATQDIIISTITEDRYMRNNIVDTMRAQLNKVLRLYDSSAIAQNDAFLLDYRGATLLTGLVDARNYSTLTRDYYWQNCFIARANIFEIYPVHPKLFVGAIRLTCESVL